MNHRIITGDCLEVLKTIDSESVDLVIADPPYNIGVDYGRGPAADRVKNYDVWCASWISLCCRALRPTGSLWVISGQEHCAHIDIAIQAAGMTMRNRVTWHETFGVYCHNKFGRCSRPIFYAVKSKDFTFHREVVTVPSARQEKYGDRRATPGGKIMGDVWEVPRVCGTFKERVPGVPTQLPSALVSRIIGVSSSIGDTVLDPFAGSGTTVAVAKQMGRHAVGIELSAEYSSIAERRVSSARSATLCH